MTSPTLDLGAIRAAADSFAVPTGVLRNHIDDLLEALGQQNAEVAHLSAALDAATARADAAEAEVRRLKLLWGEDYDWGDPADFSHATGEFAALRARLADADALAARRATEIKQWQDDALIRAKNADHWRGKADAAEAEVSRLRARIAELNPLHGAST